VGEASGYRFGHRRRGRSLQPIRLCAP
jgi:hypothetical protein